MLNTSRFLDRIRQVDHPGTLMVIFLATFEPISGSWGIPAAIRSAAYLRQLILDLTPYGASVGDLTDFTTGVFLPDSGLAEATDFTTSLREATIEEDLFIGPDDFGGFGDGQWVEIRVAIGAITVPQGTSDPRQLLEEARQRAEEDLRRYPEEWKYPITIFDD